MQLENTNSLSTETAVNPQAPSFAQLLEDYTYPDPRRGDVLSGEVVRIVEDAVYVDIGAKRDAIVPYREISQLDESFLEDINKGDEVPVYVTRTPLGSEELIVSLERGFQERDWIRARDIQESDQIVDLEIVGHNKGGLLVEFGWITGFVPNSHIPVIKSIYDRQLQAKLKGKMRGEMLSVKVLEINQKRRRLVFSATEAEPKRYIYELRLGEQMAGTVVNIVDFGAFVDIGSDLVGLLHISKISRDHIDHPSDVLSIGDKIEVEIEDVDIERKRIRLIRPSLD